MSAAWPTVALGEVTQLDLNRESIDPSKTYAMVGVLSFARGLFDREPIENGNTSYKHFLRLKPDHIVMSQLFGWEGALALGDERFAGKYLSPQFPTFLCDEGRLDRRFLGWLMRRPGFWSDLGTRASGMGDRRRTLNPSAFFACRIPLPPLDEQYRIVARIEELATKVEEAQHQRNLADRELLSLHAKMLFSTLDSVRNSTTTLGSAFVVTTGGTPSRANPSYWGGPNAWVSSGEVAFRDITNTREAITDLGLKESNAKIYPPGTVLLAMIGQGKTRGQCAVLQCAAATNQNVAAIHVTKTDHSPRYVYWWLYANYQKSRSAETGTAQPALSADRVKKMDIPLPGRIHQERIVAQLDALQAKVDSVKALQTETAAGLDAMLPAILDKAFKGEL